MFYLTWFPYSFVFKRITAFYSIQRTHLLHFFITDIKKKKEKKKEMKWNENKNEKGKKWKRKEKRQKWKSKDKKKEEKVSKTKIKNLFTGKFIYAPE